MWHKFIRELKQRHRLRNLQDMVSSSLWLVGAVVLSSAASASVSSCAQKVLLPGLRLWGRVERAGLLGSSVPSLGVRLLLSRPSWQSWGSRHHRPTSSSPSDPSEVTWSESTGGRGGKEMARLDESHLNAINQMFTKAVEKKQSKM